MATTGASRVYVKLRKSIDEGNYYEAHQMYRTLYHRYLQQKKFTQLIDLLYEGSKLFLTANQVCIF